MKNLTILLIITLLLITDYFLFSTGNASVIYSIFGGWFIINAALIVALSLYIIFRSIKTNKASFIFVQFITIITYSLILYFLSDQAREYAKEQLEAVAQGVLDNQIENVEFVSNSESNLRSIQDQSYNVVFETFIPTFRRIDHLIVLNDGRKLRLVVVKKWNNSNKVYLAETT